MATSLNSCAGETNVSFPLRTSVTDLEQYLKSIEKEKPNISAQFTVRSTNPNFSDDSRTNGEIDEALNSIEVKYNNNDYQFFSAQITLATHSNWIPKPKNSTQQVQNKIDYIVTLESKKENIEPRFVIIVVPIVVDDTVTVNNPYLQGLAYLTSDTIYSLSSIFNSLNKYVFYTTCLAPHGDKAFVYLNVDTIKINSELYHNLLAVWTQQSLNSIQTRILDNLTPLQKSLSKLFQNVKNAKNLQEIQNQISNIQASAQNPVINAMVETWPRYSPPYDIILNVPTSISSSIIEQFQNSQTASDSVSSTNNGNLITGGTSAGGSSAGGSSAGGSSTGGTSTGGGSAGRTSSSGELKCVPLDLDDATDSSGNINFDASGNVVLGNINASREKLRAYYDENQLSYEELITYTSPFFAGLIVVTALYYFAWPFIQAKFFPTYSLPPGTIQTGTYITFSIIVLFGGFLIGVSVAKAY